MKPKEQIIEHVCHDTLLERVRTLQTTLPSKKGTWFVKYIHLKPTVLAKVTVSRQVTVNQQTFDDELAAFTTEMKDIRLLHAVCYYDRNLTPIRMKVIEERIPDTLDWSMKPLF